MFRNTFASRFGGTTGTMAAVALWLLSSMSAGGASGPAPSVGAVFDRVRAHNFHPVDDRSFTIDRTLRQHGIADPDDEDWRVRLLAVRDLVRAGEEAVPDIAAGLRDEDVQVRYVCALALGVLGAKDSVADLERVVREDEDALARSEAVVALGMIGSEGSLALLRETLENDPSNDVKHQAELAVDRIDKGMASGEELRAAYESLDPADFGTLEIGAPAPDFTLTDTEGKPWRLADHKEQGWTLLIWIFADWCPVCHREFRELIDLREQFEEKGITVATIEASDRYRARVMVGKELDPDYWFADESFQDAYTDKIWWPHLVDFAGKVGARYGLDPLAYAVHAEYVNRPAAIIIDPQGKVRLAYYGTYWGDRPSIEEALDMIRQEEFDYEHPRRLKLEKE